MTKAMPLSLDARTAPAVRAKVRRSNASVLEVATEAIDRLTVIRGGRKQRLDMYVPHVDRKREVPLDGVTATLVERRSVRSQDIARNMGTRFPADILDKVKV